jgi:hypothetical protein
MTTVLVKTDSEWAKEGLEGAPIDFVTEDLTAWLTDASGG